MLTFPKSAFPTIFPKFYLYRLSDFLGRLLGNLTNFLQTFPITFPKYTNLRVNASGGPAGLKFYTNPDPDPNNPNS